MLKTGTFLLTIPLCVVVSGCGSSPTTPTPAGYEGQWSGTTFQGRPITFVVSPDQKVTTIVVGYNFGGCSGEHTFSNLNLDIGRPPNPSAPTLGPGFGYGSGPPDGPNYTQVTGAFTGSTTAIGTVIFGAYPGCGNGIANWMATRR